MNVVSASEARQTLPAQLDRVEAGEEIAITRHGRVVAVLVGPDALADRHASPASNHADLIEALLDSAAAQPLHPAGISAERAEELVEGVQVARSAG